MSSLTRVLPTADSLDGTILSPSPASAAASLGARLDRLPASRSIWRFIVLLSLGGFFEFYELFSTAYVLPGIVRSGLLKPTTPGFFAINGVGSYIAATFIGLFIGSFVLGSVADRFGRRKVFTWSLLLYCASAVAMAFQNDALGLNFWRLMTGIGLGVELVTIDAYLSEGVPAHMRGKAFALNQAVTYLAVPLVALMAFLLVPKMPLGFDGWRWVIALGAVGSLIVWVLRLGLAESPRWLASIGQFERAEKIVADLEARVERETKRPLPIPRATTLVDAKVGAPTQERGSFRELWTAQYAPRTVMLVVFHAAQAIGLYGFANWAPTFLLHRGSSVESSLGQGLAIAAFMPLGPIIAMAFADRIERKWQIVFAAVVVSLAGLGFAAASSKGWVILCGMLVTLGATVVSLNFHAYQSELFPTRIRALAVGFVYSASRISGMLSGFLIAWTLKQAGVSAALMLISACMAIAALSIGLFGPRTRGRSLEELNR